MRVLHLAKYYPPIWGGIESVVYNFATFNDNVTTEVYCFNSNDVKEKNIHCFKSLATIMGQPLSLSYIRNYLKKYRGFDVVHFHVPNYIGLLCLALSKTNKTKLIVHWHSDVLKKPSLLIKILGVLEKYALKKANIIVSTSYAYYKSSDSLKRRNNIKVIPLSLPNIKPQRRAKIKFRSDTFIIIARLVPYKGLLSFLVAFAKLEKGILTIVGSGPLKKAILSKIREHKLENRVNLKENLSYINLQKEINKASTLCLPSISRQEAFGVVLLEAMRAGLRLLVTDVDGSGMKEVCKNSYRGIIVKPNVDSIKDGLITALNTSDSELVEISERNRLVFKTKYSNDVIFQQWKELYAG